MPYFAKPLAFSLFICFLLISLSLPCFAEQNPPPETPAQTEPNKAPEQEKKTNKNSKGSPNTIKLVEPIKRFNQQQGDLKHYLVNENVTPLLAQTDEYLTVITEHKTEFNKGVMILIPDWQQNATSPTAINYLRQQLPFDGWTTIAVHPPEPPENYPSVALKQSKRREENQQALAQYQQQLASLMTVVMAKAEQYPGVFVVVAQGRNGAMVINNYANNSTKLPNALVLLSAYLPSKADNDAFTTNVANSELAILDLHLSKDQALALTSAQERAIKAKHQLKSYYRQRAILNIEFGYYPHQSLRSNLLGWLTAIGW